MISLEPGIGGSQWFQRDLALKLSALMQARNDGSDEQLLRVGMDMRIESDAPGIHAGSRRMRRRSTWIAAVDAKLSRSVLLRIKIKVGDAFGRVGVAGNGFQQAHIQFAFCLCLPAGTGEIEERPGDVQGAIAIAPCCAT